MDIVCLETRKDGISRVSFRRTYRTESRYLRKYEGTRHATERAKAEPLNGRKKREMGIVRSIASHMRKYLELVILSRRRRCRHRYPPLSST